MKPMRVTIALICCMLVGGVGRSDVRAQNADSSAAREAVLDVQQAWLNAFQNDDVATARRIVADGFVITYADGRIRTKGELLASMSPADTSESGAEQYAQRADVRLFGDSTAVVTGVYVFAVRGKVWQRSYYTDTYVRRDGQWQIVASHLSSPSR